MKTIIFLAILSLSLETFSQDKNCKFTINKTDDFTKKQIVRTKPLPLFENKAGAFWNSALFNENGTQVEFTVSADYEGGYRYLLFILNESKNAKNTEDYSKIDFLLTSGSIIEFSKPSNSGYNFKGANMYWRYYQLTDNQWSTFKTIPIKKIRLYYENNTQGDIDINKNYANNISKAITCIDDMNLPVSNGVNNNKNINDNLLNANTNDTIVEMPIPLNDTSTVTLFKQWKMVVQTNKDGVPFKDFSLKILQQFKDGTFKVYTKLNNGKTLFYQGKFDIISDGKVLVYTPEKGNGWTDEVTKLTNKELVKKSKDGMKYLIAY